MAARKLNYKQKHFIVVRLAQFERPRDIARALKENLGVEVSMPGILCYDPTTAQGRFLSDDWTQLFWKVRQNLLNMLEDTVPIACFAYRLNSIQKIIDANENDPYLVLKALKLAAKDAEGYFYKHRPGPPRRSNPYTK